jgi:hypothetical protein
MEGRWTINVCSGCGLLIPETFEYRHAGHGPELPVPVVPSDDAAIDRVAARLADEYMGGWANLDENTRGEIRGAAADLLRAAGETL